MFVVSISGDLLIIFKASVSLSPSQPVHSLSRAGDKALLSSSRREIKVFASSEKLSLTLKKTKSIMESYSLNFLKYSFGLLPSFTASTKFLMNKGLFSNLLHQEIIFSSSAAVYGEPKAKLLTEEHSINPINPYGETKAKVENMLKNYDKNHNLKSRC